MSRPSSAPPTVSAAAAGPERDRRGFRLRGREVSRVEALSDGVFAFAITLLVVTLEVPKTYAELRAAMSGFVAFAACFAMLVFVWVQHHVFFRRYGLQDGATIVWNAILLFVVLFYVFPMKFLARLLLGNVLGIAPHGAAPYDAAPPLDPSDTVGLMVVYGAGYVAVFGTFLALYLHAWRQRAQLGLDAGERLLTRQGVRDCWVHVGVGSLSIAIAALGGPPCAGIAGWTYLLLAPLLTLNGIWTGRQAAAAR